MEGLNPGEFLGRKNPRTLPTLGFSRNNGKTGVNPKLGGPKISQERF